MNKLTTETTPTPGTPLVAEQGRPYTPGQGEAMRTPATMETAARAGSRREPLHRAERILTTVLGALLGSVILGFVAIGSQLMSMHEAIGELRTEMHEAIGGLRTEMHVEISGLRNEMHEEIGELRNEISGLRTEMHVEIGGLRDEMRTEMGKLSDRMTRIETSLQIRPGPLPGP